MIDEAPDRSVESLVPPRLRQSHIVARKNAEKECNDVTCVKFDFSQARDLIDLVVGLGKAHLWIVIGSPSRYRFTDGRRRNTGKEESEETRHFRIATINAQNKETGIGEFLPGNLDDLDSTHVRESQVNQDDIWLVLVNQLDRVGSGAGHHV